MNLLPDSWDCHVHVLDPDKFPYRQDRSYTPAGAPLESLLNSVKAENIVIVQASVEDGYDCLLAHLKASNRSLRGAIISDPTPTQDITRRTDEQVDLLHSAGVRAIRLQAVYGAISGISALKQYIGQLSRSYAVQKLNWAIEIQLPLKAWTELHEFFCDKSLAHVRFIADHNGSATPDDVGSSDFDLFLGLLQQGRIWVKVAALHRRAEDVEMMEGIVKALVGANSGQVIYGSDWPHVAAHVKGMTPTPHLQVDDVGELELIRSWLTPQQWQAMMVENPRALFV